MSEAERFAELLQSAMTVSSGVAAPLFRHFELMRHWNKKLNLTRVDSLEEAVVRHYAESLFLAAQLPSGIRRVIDVGSGAGFPGFPVAALRPELEVTLVESDQRKAAFLRETTDLLPNLRVRASRAQSLAMPVDFITSRAVKPQEVIGIAENLGVGWALLVGEEDAGKLMSDGVTAIPVPFRSGSVVVSRGTSSA